MPVSSTTHELWHRLTKAKSRSSLRSETTFWETIDGRKLRVLSSDTKERKKDISYQKAEYPKDLELKGNSFMKKVPANIGIGEDGVKACEELFNRPHSPPENTLFDDDKATTTLDKVIGRNETKIIQDIGRLIVPSVHHEYIRGARHLEILEESANELWNRAIPVTDKRPQPDYAVGLSRDAFTPAQWKKLEKAFGGPDQVSELRATDLMFLPFFTCEVKSSAREGMIIADRQNAHSMTFAARAIVNLFRLADRVKDVHRRILAFSISHTDESARIFCCVALVEEDGDVKYYCHELDPGFYFKAEGGRWKAYKFTRNLYDYWVPRHLEMLNDVINLIPGDLPQHSASTSQTAADCSTGASQTLECLQLPDQSRTGGSEPSRGDASQESTSWTSLSEIPPVIEQRTAAAPPPPPPPTGKSKRVKRTK